MNTILLLGTKLAFTQARRRRVLEGLSSLNIIATKEASLASAIAGKAKPAMRVSELMQGGAGGAEGLLQAAQAAKKPAMRVSDFAPAAAKADPFAAATPKASPFAGAGAAPAPRAPMAPMEFAQGAPGSFEHFIMEAQRGKGGAPSLVDALGSRDFMARMMNKSASLSVAIERAKQAGAAHKAAGFTPDLRDARALGGRVIQDAGLGAGFGGMYGAVDEDGELSGEGALRGALAGGALGALTGEAGRAGSRALQKIPAESIPHGIALGAGSGFLESSPVIAGTLGGVLSNRNEGAEKSANAAAHLGNLAELVGSNPRLAGGLLGAGVGGAAGAASAEEGKGLQGALLGAGLGGGAGALAAPKLLNTGAQGGAKLLARANPEASSDALLNAAMAGGLGTLGVGVGAGAAGLGAGGGKVAAEYTANDLGAALQGSGIPLVNLIGSAAATASDAQAAPEGEGWGYGLRSFGGQTLGGLGGGLLGYGIGSAAGLPGGAQMGLASGGGALGSMTGRRMMLGEDRLNQVAAAKKEDKADKPQSKAD
jgi:hypothetical protein